ncbi:hypothetical protein Hanom_Chr15g01381361 [Helianthus anomalus]
MNAVGRHGQSQRFGASGVHHQRQHSDNFLEATSSSANGRWLQPPSNASFAFGYQGARMYDNSSRNVGVQRSLSGGSDLFAEALTPPRQKHDGGDDNNGFSLCLLDLHSFDTELISNVSSLPLLDKLSCYSDLMHSFYAPISYISKQESRIY